MQNELIVREEKYNYPGYHRSSSYCKLELYKRSDGMYIAVCTELADNPGTSVTNQCEVLATQIIKQYNLHPEVLLFVEHYDEGSYHGGTEKDRSYTRVDFFEWENGEAKRPLWFPLPNLEIVLTGE